MKQAVRFFNEAMGSGATPAQIHTNISKALKSAGFKVKKFQKMSSGHGGVWGGFYTVGDGMVLPFHVKKDGKVSYDAGPKDWIIGNIDYVDVMTRILKQVKKTPDYGQDTISKVRRTKKIASEGTRFRVRKSDARAVTKLILRNGWSAEKANMGRDVRFDIEGDDKKIMNTLAKHGIIISHLDEGNLPSNIQKWIKERGPKPSKDVKLIGKWVKKLTGREISGGVAIGKNYNTLVLDIEYQDAAIYYDTTSGDITLYDKKIRNFNDFKKVFQANESVNEGFSSSLVKKAIDIAKKMGGNMTGAVKLIDKIKKGLSDDPKVKAALQAANESVNEAYGDLNDAGFKKIKDGFKYLDKVVKKLQAAAKKEDGEETVKSIKGLYDIAGIMYDMIGVPRFYESVNTLKEINVEPNWEGMWRFFKRMAKTNPRDWKKMERTLGSEWVKIDKMAQQKGWVSESVVATMRTRSGTRALEKKGGKLIMKMPNGEVLKFKDGADVKEYMDRVYGYWSFIKGYGKVKGLREIKTDPKAAAGVRTSKGPIDIFIEKGKPVIYARNERLEFKNGKDVREYLDRIYGHWSFFKGKDNNPIKGLRESTAAYEKALQKIAKDKQLGMLSKKDRETLLKVAQLMKSANENKKIDEKVAMPLGDHLTTATKELDYMIKVGPIEDAYDSPKVSLKVIKMARKLLDKVN